MVASGGSAPGVVRGLPMVLLRSEGAALLLISVILYTQYGKSWVLFAILLLAPDLGMLGYLRNRRIGALTYDLAHTYLLPAALGIAGVLAENATLYSIALIWFAHIGLDRLVGYGLKYPSSFQHTHLGFLGGQRARG